jgi:hypothetical protein
LDITRKIRRNIEIFVADTQFRMVWLRHPALNPDFVESEGGKLASRWWPRSAKIPD